MKRWIGFVAQFFVGAIVFVALNWSLQASAQFQIPDIPVDIPANVPGLEDLLAKDPALTTSLEDAQQEVPFLDDYNPSTYRALRLLPLDEDNNFIVPPGDYAFNAQSYCLRAGTHVPGSGDGYLYAPLQGDAADIVQNVLRRSVDRPDIPQQQVQMLLWAIVAQSDLAALPAARSQVARDLLTEEEFDRLSRNAFGPIPKELLQRALQELPPIAQQVFEANARIRSTITEANSSFEDIERVAVLLGEPPESDDGRNVPTQRWSYNPDGYFMRYQPSGYSITEMHVSMPEPIELTRDNQGRITALTNSDGNRIEIQYDDSVAPLTVSGDNGVSGYAIRSVRMVRDELMPPETILSFDRTWNGRGWTLVGVPQGDGQPQASRPYSEAANRYRQANRYQQQQANVFEQVDIASNSAAMQDLADIYHLQQAIAPMVAPATDSWQAAQLELLPRAWQYQLCRHAGTCNPIANRPREILMASVNGIHLAQGDRANGTPFDPSGGAAVPATPGKQRLGQSNRPIPEEDLSPEKDPRCKAVRDELNGLKLVQSVFGDPDVVERARNEGLDREGFNDLVKEELKQRRRNRGNNSDIEVGAQTNVSTCEITISSLREFKNQGVPGIVREAYLNHEQLHKLHCLEYNDPDFSSEYDNFEDYLNEPENYSREEVEAYQESIDTLDRWLDEHC
jgi:hypothetical protein